MKKKLITSAALALAGLLASANAATITVNTVDNKDFSAGKTNLWLAIQMANTNGEAANTINFNIPGDGPHYLITPPLSTPGGGSVAAGGGFPVITNSGLTIDGYSQPGALANTNTILGSNTAVLKIVIDSRAANYTPDPDHLAAVGAETMSPPLITGKTYETTEWGWPSFDAGDAAQICIYNASNVTIKGLCFLNDYFPGENGLEVSSIALGADFPTNYYAPTVCNSDQSCHFYPDYNLHVAGCWFNLMPDGVTVVDGGMYAVTVLRTKGSGSGNGYNVSRWSPSGNTIGVAKNSANPRAEFNIIMSQSQGTGMNGQRDRYCGNFFNVLADGMTQYLPDPQRIGDVVNTLYVPTFAFIGQNYAGYTIIGTDGDGINDAEERNVFAGLPRARDDNQAIIDHQCGSYNCKVSGNYFGVAVDGVTRFTNSCLIFRFSNRPDYATNCVFGSDFDGVSDDIEGNVICNHWPLDYWFPNQATEPDLNLYAPECYLAPYFQAGAPADILATDKLLGAYYYSFRGNKCINNFTGPLSPFGWSEDSSPDILWYFNHYFNVVSTNGPWTSPNGTAYEAATNFITVLDPSSSTRRLKGTFPLPVNPTDQVIIDVYVANEEGLTNGAKFQTLTNILPVWAQGETTLAYNLQADGAADLDPATGAFNFSIAPYNIPAGTKVTVTASYAKAGAVGTYMAEMHTSRFSLPVTLNASTLITVTSIVNNGDGTGTINWTGGEAPYIVEQCTNLTSAVWVPVATTTSPTITGGLGLPAAFYRIQ